MKTSVPTNPDNYDFELYTDGSGHLDGYGGHAVVGFSLRHKKFFVRHAAVNGTSTARQETEALLNGLQAILEELDQLNRIPYLEVRPLTVYWISDREDIVLSVTRGEDGQPIYRRKANGDLWARFAWYERLFKITAVYAERNTIPYQELADRLASEGRTLIKNYAEVLKADGAI